MTVAKTIAYARQQGLTRGYANILSGAIRAALSARSAKAFRTAIAEDRAEHLFKGLDTSCPWPV